MKRDVDRLNRDPGIDPVVEKHEIVHESTLVDAWIEASNNGRTEEAIRGLERMLADNPADANAAVLVMGERGHGAIGSALLGSVSTWLLHHVHVPLVIVPSGERSND